MKFLREDNEVTYCGEDPIDRNDPEGAKDAVEMTLHTGFFRKGLGMLGLLRWHCVPV